MDYKKTTIAQQIFICYRKIIYFIMKYSKDKCAIFVHFAHLMVQYYRKQLNIQYDSHFFEIKSNIDMVLLLK